MNVTKNNQLNMHYWTTDETTVFLKYGSCFVPEREALADAFVHLIPRNFSTPGCLVDICCGGGYLTRTLLENFQNETVLAMDRDVAMLEETKKICKKNDYRLKTAEFDIHDKKWREFKKPVHAFVSSLAIHHLDCDQKRVLFSDLFGQLEEGGCLLIADLLKPSCEEAKKLAAKGWDEETKRQSLEAFGTLEAYEAFNNLDWNYFSDPNAENETIDKPSTLFNQLMWLKKAGFENVDVFWAKAGHALFGGYKPKWT